MRTNKILIVGALVITLSIVIIGISGSYAYYVNSMQEVNSANKGVTVSSGDLTMNFATTQYISASAATLINDSDITTKADYTAFSVSLPSNAVVSSALYELYLTDITMTNNFKSADLKWALYKSNVQVASGDFSSIALTNSSGSTCTTYTSGSALVSCTGTKFALKDSISIAKGDTDSYNLYIWLSNATDRNQTDLLEGSLSAKVAFKGVTP